MNTCPCGYFSNPQKACTCAPAVVTKYQKRISGTLLDCSDIHIAVTRVDYEQLSGDRMRGCRNLFVPAYKMHKIFNGHVLRISNHQILLLTPIGASGRSGNFASCRMRRHVDSSSFAHRVETSELDAGGNIVLCMTQLDLSARAYHRGAHDRGSSRE